MVNDQGRACTGPAPAGAQPSQAQHLICAWWSAAVRAFLPVVFLTGSVSPLYGQQPRPSDPLGDDQRLVGQVVRVTTDGGDQATGLLAAIDLSALRIEGATPKSVARADITRLEVRGDSLKNGAIVGMIVALAVSPLALQGYDSAGQWAKDLPLAVVVFAGAGVGIDALKTGWTEVNISPTSSDRKLSLRRQAVGVGVTLTF
jgi:hypothetical protein